MADFDLAIIGGGINGAGIARDAAGRGLKVVLLEQSDLASGTSSASSKLIHGGLRYLEHGALRLVRAALSEREVLLRMAPHLDQAASLRVAARFRCPLLGREPRAVSAHAPAGIDKNARGHDLRTPRALRMSRHMSPRSARTQRVRVRITAPRSAASTALSTTRRAS